jgi:hypothetical protein
MSEVLCTDDYLFYYLALRVFAVACALKKKVPEHLEKVSFSCQRKMEPTVPKSAWCQQLRHVIQKRNPKVEI